MRGTRAAGGFFVGIVGICLLANAQQPLTLRDALRRALQSNGEIQSALAERRAAEARLMATRADLFPSIEWSSSSTRTRLEQGGATAETTTRQQAFLFDWLLFDAGQRENRIRQASRSHELARQSARTTIRSLLFQTANAYYEVLRRQELLRVADESVQRAQTLLDVAKTQAEVGAAPAKDVLQAEADLANARVQQIQARNALRLAETDLKRLIGWDTAQPLPPLQRVESAPEFTQPPTLDELWQRARQQHPELRTAQLRVQVAQLGVEIARINTISRIQISLNGFLEYDPDRRTQGQLRFLISSPLFDGGLVRANLREAEAEYQSARFRLQQLERDLYAEVESALLTRLETAERLSAAQAALAAAQRNYDAARNALREGAGTIVEVLTAQLALVTAETNLVQAVYDSYIAELRLKLATGDPLPEEPT
ncbi:Outer membrane protein TolC [bacterium HR15]|nr:Outer membrane protein TolC [bacterium HR15]